jgi:voltage-gated potassium channel Kch
MHNKPTLRERWNYWFDNYMSRGTLALITGLAVLSLIIIVIAAIVISLGGRALAPGEATEGMSFGEAVWESLMRTLDAGTLGGDVGWGFRAVMFFVTIGGVFIFSTLIGVLTSGVEGKIDELRKGRSRVLEQEHTVILGWSAQVFTIIPELVAANESRKTGAVIAILAEKDKVEMEDELRARVGSTKNTKVICRSGSPIDPSELEIVSPHTARAIIILPPEEGDPDAAVIKTTLALTNSPHRRSEPYHIITQIQGSRNLQVIQMLGEKDDVQAIQTGDLVARVTAQTSRQSGLSVVYTELLNFGGDEIYFKEEPTLSGKTFGDVLPAYDDATVMGLMRADKTVQLSPAMDTRLAPGDLLIVLAADDNAIHLSELTVPPVKAEAIRSSGRRAEVAPEKGLILGWNSSTAIIVREMENYVAAGSTITIVAGENFQPEVQAIGGLVNQQLIFRAGDTTDRALLDDLKIFDYDHVIVLADTTLSVQEADARTLITLLHLRNIAERDSTPFSIVSEMLDLRNRELAEVAKVDDFIVSDHLISLMLAQLSENSYLYHVFMDLFDPEGVEIYLKPVSDYIDTTRPVNFYTVIEAARRRGETAIGYRSARELHDAANAYGVHTNPKKSVEVAFSPEDKMIVLANH